MSEPEKMVQVPLAWLIGLKELNEKVYKASNQDVTMIHLLHGYLETVQYLINRSKESEEIGHFHFNNPPENKNDIWLCHDKDCLQRAKVHYRHNTQK